MLLHLRPLIEREQGAQNTMDYLLYTYRALSVSTFHFTGGLKAFVFSPMLFTAQVLNLEIEIKKAIFIHYTVLFFISFKCLSYIKIYA